MGGDEGGDKDQEDKDLELDLMAEQELLRLTRQYRVMEGDKEAYLEEATKALRRQRKTIEDLEKEKKELSRSLKMSRSRKNNRKDSENAAKLARLAAEQENLITSIQEEKLITTDLESEIHRIERQITNQRRVAQAGPAAGAKSSANLREKRDIGQRIVLLENRLDGVMISFNATLSQNSHIRKEIDHLVQERSTFNDMIAKLQKKIAANKKTIADITEMSIQAFDQRDECQSKIQALQDRNEKDAVQYTAELKELQRTLDHDEKLKDFLFHKSNDRVFATQFEDDKKEKGKKAAEEKELEDAQRFKEAFEKIRKIVGQESSLDKIVTDFVKVEDQNFALFNYVTEMNNQVEALQEGIGRLRADIKEAKGRGEERERAQREQLAAMEKKLGSSTHEADSAETKLSLMESVISKLKVGTEDLYILAKVGSTPVLSLLGGETTGAAVAKIGGGNDDVSRPFVNEGNVIMYLDMIHEKIIELKGIDQFVDYKNLQAGTVSAFATANSAIGRFNKALDVGGATGGASSAGPIGVTAALASSAKEKLLKKTLSSAQLLGKGGESLALENDSDDESKPFDMSALKTRAFVIAQRERRESIVGLGTQGGSGPDGVQGGKGAKSKALKM